MNNYTNPKCQWYVEPPVGWKITTNFNEAFIDYIGEVVITPKPSYNMFRKAIGLPPIPSTTVYYHGEPDSNLLTRFGYVEPGADGFFS